MMVLPQGIAVLGASIAVLVAPGGFLPGMVLRLVGVAIATAYAVVADRRASDQQRALLALGLGVIGSLLGYGIGITHTVAEGLSLRTAAGLTAMLTGVCLLVTGLVAMLRTFSVRHRLLVLGCIPFSFAFVVAPVGLAVAAANPAPSFLGGATPGDRGNPYDDVQLRTTDGLTLQGWYVPSRNRASVALVHDAGTTRSSLLAAATALADDGYGVLLFDTRGNGSSEGDPMDLGWYGERDVSAAVTFLSDRYDVDRDKIGLIGVGRGGEAAVMTAASDDRVHAVVAEGVGRRTPVDTFTLPLGPLGWLQGASETVEYVTAGFLRQSLPPRSLFGAIRSTAPRPVLLIAEDGSLVASRMYRKTEPASVSLWEIPTVPQGQAYTFRAAGWEEQVGTFLQRALKPRPTPPR